MSLSVPGPNAERGPVSSGLGQDGRPRALWTQPKIGMYDFLTPQAEWGDAERGNPLPYTLLFRVSALQTTADGAGMIPLVGVPIVATLAAGVAFARLIGPSRHERVAWRSAFGVGLTFVVASFLGFMGALAIESTGIRQPDGPRLMLFRLAFVVGSALVAFTSVSGASWILGLRGWFRRALSVAGVTAATYVVVVLLLDLIPGWHVGGGNLAMLKVASVGNFCAGLAGGTVAYWLVTRADFEAFSSKEPGAKVHK